MIIRNDNLNLNISNVCICDKQYNELMKYLWAINNRLNNLSVVREILIKEQRFISTGKKIVKLPEPTIIKPIKVDENTFIIDQTLKSGYTEGVTNYDFYNKFGALSYYKELYWLIDGNRRRLIYKGKGVMPDDIKSIFKIYNIPV